jgi:histone H3/H4
MNPLSNRALKNLIRETGARAGRGAARELARSLEEIAWEIAERSRDLAEHAGRRTIKEKDIRFAAREMRSSN